MSFWQIYTELVRAIAVNEAVADVAEMRRTLAQLRNAMQFTLLDVSNAKTIKNWRDLGAYPAALITAYDGRTFRLFYQGDNMPDPQKRRFAFALVPAAASDALDTIGNVIIGMETLPQVGAFLVVNDIAISAAYARAGLFVPMVAAALEHTMRLWPYATRRPKYVAENSSLWQDKAAYAVMLPLAYAETALVKINLGPPTCVFSGMQRKRRIDLESVPLPEARRPQQPRGGGAENAIVVSDDDDDIEEGDVYHVSDDVEEDDAYHVADNVEDDDGYRVADDVEEGDAIAVNDVFVPATPDEQLDLDAFSPEQRRAFWDDMMQGPSVPNIWVPDSQEPNIIHVQDNGEDRGEDRAEDRDEDRAEDRDEDRGEDRGEDRDEDRGVDEGGDADEDQEDRVAGAEASFRGRPTQRYHDVREFTPVQAAEIIVPATEKLIRMRSRQRTGQHVAFPRLRIAPSTIPGAGYGVFAGQPISRNAFITEYGGLLLDNRVEPTSISHIMSLTMGADVSAYRVDGRPFAQWPFRMVDYVSRHEVMQFMNSSVPRTQQANAKRVTADDMQPDASNNFLARPRTFVVATRDIAEGEEIFFSYLGGRNTFLQ